jgi:signal transduction histidine kinase
LLRAVFACLVVALAGPATARPPPPPLPGTDGPVALGRYLEILEDRDGKLTLQEVRGAKFEPSQTDTPNFGFTRSAIWLRFRLPDAVQGASELLLEIRWPNLDRIELFLPGNRSVLAGDAFPWRAREVKHRNHVFRISPMASESDYYLRVESAGTLTIPAHLWRPETFVSHDRDAQLLFGMFYGLALALVLYNLMLYVSVRDRTYLYYILYASTFALFLSSLDGLAFEYLWPENVWAANKGSVLTIAVSLVCAAQFSRSFLGTPRTAPRFDRALLAIIAAAVLLMAGSWTLSQGHMVRAATLLVMIFTPITFAAAISALWNGYRPARYFVLAWGALIAGTFTFTLRNLAILPHNAFTIYSMYVGFGLDVLLLSFALGDRINAMKREGELARSQASAMEIASRHKSEFLANMSHELRTPLNAIIGFSEVLRERYFGPLAEKQAEYVNDIHSAGRHLLSLINDILDLSKVEAGRMELELSDFDLPAALDDSLTLIKERALRGGITLEKEVHPAIGAIRADERKLKQIMLNLLSNAVKFTAEGGRVSVAAKLNGGNVEISVSDTGVGIAPEDHAAVFEEFKQVGRDSARKAEGTGLGMALTKRFVELHGGSIRLQSTPGKGSIFSFILPLSRP